MTDCNFCHQPPCATPRNHVRPSKTCGVAFGKEKDPKATAPGFATASLRHRTSKTWLSRKRTRPRKSRNSTQSAAWSLGDHPKLEALKDLRRSEQSVTTFEGMLIDQPKPERQLQDMLNQLWMAQCKKKMELAMNALQAFAHSGAGMSKMSSMEDEESTGPSHKSTYQAAGVGLVLAHLISRVSLVGFPVPFSSCCPTPPVHSQSTYPLPAISMLETNCSARPPHHGLSRPYRIQYLILMLQNMNMSILPSRTMNIPITSSPSLLLQMLMELVLPSCFCRFSWKDSILKPGMSSSSILEMIFFLVKEVQRL